MPSFLTTPLSDRLSTLGLMVAAGGPLLTPKLHLSISNITPGEDTILADFTPATFTGSAAVTVVWGPPYIDPISGAAWVVAPGVTFVASAVATPETIYSFFLTDAASADYHGGGRVEPEVPITAVGDGLTIQVILPYGG